MNIISNSCVGGHLYKNNIKTEFKNPFIWGAIDFKSMVHMIRHWNNIDWNNFRIEKDKKWNFSIIIDDHITMQCVHYKYDANAESIYTKNLNVFSNKIWEYIANKYKERLNRMIEEKEKPFFVFADRWNRPETKITYKRLEFLNSLKHDNIVCALRKSTKNFLILSKSFAIQN